jgi:hypothetical protein
VVNTLWEPLEPLRITDGPEWKLLLSVLYYIVKVVAALALPKSERYGQLPLSTTANVPLAPTRHAWRKIGRRLAL